MTRQEVSRLICAQHVPMLHDRCVRVLMLIPLLAKARHGFMKLEKVYWFSFKKFIDVVDFFHK